MWREFRFNGKYKWIDMYNQLINKYNKRVHRTIKLIPSIVNSSNEIKYYKQPTLSWKNLLQVNSERGATFVLININMSLRKGIHQAIQLKS